MLPGWGMENDLLGNYTFSCNRCSDAVRVVLHHDTGAVEEGGIGYTISMTGPMYANIPLGFYGEVVDALRSAHLHSVHHAR